MTVSVTALDVPPPGAGVATVSARVPPDATSLAVSVARTCVALAYVVGRATPFQAITELRVKPLPFTVDVKAGLPATTLAGLRLLSIGAGGTSAKLITALCAIGSPPAVHHLMT